jgi:hypothetical protein
MRQIIEQKLGNFGRSLFLSMRLSSQLNVLKKQRHQYSVKKKCHTQKSQILADMKAGKILSAAFCAGRKHDFQLFKENGIELPPHVLLLADAGYQGVAKIHPNSLTPINYPAPRGGVLITSDFSKYTSQAKGY